MHTEPGVGRAPAATRRHRPAVAAAPDAAVARYLPDVVPGELGRRVTVRMLLNHTSGIGGYAPVLFAGRPAAEPRSAGTDADHGRGRTGSARGGRLGAGQPHRAVGFRATPAAWWATGRTPGTAPTVVGRSPWRSTR